VSDNIPNKYYWTSEKQAELVELRKKSVTDPAVLAKEMSRQPLGIQRKLERVGVVVGSQKSKTTTTVALGKNLLTHEEALKGLAMALELLRQPRQDSLELQGLRILVDAVQVYDSVLEKFVRWAENEKRLLEMDKRIAELQKAQKIQS